MATLTRASSSPVNAWDITHRVEADIAFLVNRLETLRQQQDPNPVIIDTYEGMLANRQQLLVWLHEGKRR
jgi:hypothetical protein